MSEIKCEVCRDTGYYGDNGPGIRGNREFVECDQCRPPRPKQTDDPFDTIAKLRSDLEAATQEVQRLNDAKTIVLGKCKVIIAAAHEVGKETDNEILIIDAEDRKACIGQAFPELVGQTIDNDDKRLLARLVIAHPDGAEVLIQKIEEVVGGFEKEQGE